MSITNVHKDTDQLSLSITAEYRAPVAQVWALWADPRKLERWWGPPTYPATVTEHDLAPGGRVQYYMTGPEGDRYHGYWDVLTVDEPHRFEAKDGFADDQGQANDDLPTSSFTVEIASGADGATVMSITSRFPSLDAMNQMIEMGMEEGMQQALGQIDAILVESTTP